MRKIISIVTLITAVVAVSTTANAQATGTAASGSTVVTPISISKLVDLNFGNVAVTSTAGTVVLLPDGTRSKTGGVTLSTANPGAVAAASFTVSGQGSYTYAITLPTSDITLTGVTAANTMTLGSFTSTPSATGTLANGTQNLLVGGTLAVKAEQGADTYSNAAGLSVTVNYN
jgi:hypothetical protein